MGDIPEIPERNKRLIEILFRKKFTMHEDKGRLSFRRWYGITHLIEITNLTDNNIPATFTEPFHLHIIGQTGPVVGSPFLVGSLKNFLEMDGEEFAEILADERG